MNEVDLATTPFCERLGVEHFEFACVISAAAWSAHMVLVLQARAEAQAANDKLQGLMSQPGKGTHTHGQDDQRSHDAALSRSADLCKAYHSY